MCLRNVNLTSILSTATASCAHQTPGDLYALDLLCLLLLLTSMLFVCLDCAGGYLNKSINTMECYFLETKKWKRCADLQVPRSGVGVVSLHMRVYVIGGRYNTR